MKREAETLGNYSVNFISLWSTSSFVPFLVSQRDLHVCCSKISTPTIGMVWELAWELSRGARSVWWIIPNTGKCLNTVDTVPDCFKVTGTPVDQCVLRDGGAGSGISSIHFHLNLLIFYVKWRYVYAYEPVCVCGQKQTYIFNLPVIQVCSCSLYTYRSFSLALTC